MGDPESEAQAGGECSTAKIDWVDAALRAAEAGNLVGMLEALHTSKFLEGLARILRKRWRHLDEDECHTVVGKATDAFYAKASGGEKIREPEAYLYKVSMNIAHDECEVKMMHTEFNEEVHHPEPGAPRGGDPDALRARALEIARGLLPQLGQENVRQVMSFYLDAVEKRIEHVATEDVAEALGLSNDTVRQCKSRGFRRLARAAREQGIKLEEAIEGSEGTEEVLKADSNEEDEP